MVFCPPSLFFWSQNSIWEWSNDWFSCSGQMHTKSWAFAHHWNTKSKWFYYSKANQTRVETRNKQQLNNTCKDSKEAVSNNDDNSILRRSNSVGLCFDLRWLAILYLYQDQIPRLHAPHTTGHWMNRKYLKRNKCFLKIIQSHYPTNNEEVNKFIAIYLNIKEAIFSPCGLERWKILVYFFLIALCIDTGLSYQILHFQFHQYKVYYYYNSTIKTHIMYHIVSLSSL